MLLEKETDINGMFESMKETVEVTRTNVRRYQAITSEYKRWKVLVSVWHFIFRKLIQTGDLFKLTKAEKKELLNVVAQLALLLNTPGYLCKKFGGKTYPHARCPLLKQRRPSTLTKLCLVQVDESEIKGHYISAPVICNKCSNGNPDLIIREIPSLTWNRSTKELPIIRDFFLSVYFPHAILGHNGVNFDNFITECAIVSQILERGKKTIPKMCRTLKFWEQKELPENFMPTVTWVV